MFFCQILPIMGASVSSGLESDSPIPMTRATHSVNRTDGGDFTTIQAAVDAAASGDIIEVDAGTYREHVIITGKSLTIKGEDPSTTIIDGDEIGVGINLMSSNNRIENMRVRNSEHGIKISSSENNIITNCHLVYNSFTGIRFSGVCRYNSITNSLCSRNEYGIRLYDGCDLNTLTGNRCENNSYGIYIQNSDNNTITDNICKYNEVSTPTRDVFFSAGIYANGDCHYNSISSNTCNSNGEYGLYIYQSNRNSVEKNTCKNNKNDGIFLSGASFNILGNNTVENNERYGIQLFNSRSNVLNKNELASNLIYGIYIDSSPYSSLFENEMTDCGLYMAGDDLEDWNTHVITQSNTVEDGAVKYVSDASGDVISGATYGGVILANCTGVTVTDVESKGGSIGIILGYSSYNTVSECKFNSNSHYGVLLYGYSDYNIIANNTCNQNRYGIYVNEFCLSNELNDNTCNDNELAGIFVADHSNDQSLKRNSCKDNFDGIEISSSSNSISSNICEANTAKGILFNEGSSGNLITANTCRENLHGIYMLNTGANTLRSNFASSNTGKGIALYTATTSTLEDNECFLNQEEGIYVGSFQEKSSNIVIRGNDLENNSYGLILVESDHCTVSENKFYSNENDGMVLSHSATNIVTGNTLGKNDMYGLRFSEVSSGNTVEKNDFEDNGNYAILLDSGSSNEIKYNRFADNNGGSNQASDNGSGNLWDDGDGEGNYWSDYTTRYPGATNDGGVWKTDYLIDGSAGEKDHFPLFQSFDLSSPVADAGDDAEIGQGYRFTFDASGSGDDRGIVNYTWTFIYEGVTTTLYETGPSFVFGEVGTYIVTLRVTDAGGNTGDDTVTIKVIDKIPPVLVIDTDMTVDQDKNASLDGTKCYDNIGIVNYTWKFTYDNKEHIRYSQKFSFLFAKVGTYKITLILTDAAGIQATGIINLTSRDVIPPKADAGKDINVNKGDKAHFKGDGSSDNVGITNYTWSFFYDGSTKILLGASPDFTFNISGNYTVLLTVLDAARQAGSDEVKVNVKRDDENDDDDDITPGNDDDDITPGDDDTNSGTSGVAGINNKLLIGIGAAAVVAVILIVIVIMVKKKSARKAKRNVEKSEYENLYGNAGRKPQRRGRREEIPAAGSADALDDSWMKEVLDSEEYSAASDEKMDGKRSVSRRRKAPVHEGRRQETKYEMKHRGRSVKKVQRSQRGEKAGRASRFPKETVDSNEIEFESKKGLDIEAELDQFHEEIDDGTSGGETAWGDESEKSSTSWDDGDSEVDDKVEDNERKGKDDFGWADDKDDEENDEEVKDIAGWDDEDDEWEV